MRNDSTLARLEPLRALRAAALALPLAFGLAAPAAAEAPAFSMTDTKYAAPGIQLSVPAEFAFDNAGTNPRFTAAEFSTTEYYDRHALEEVESYEGVLVLRAKTSAELNALAAPPPSPFTVTVDVTMTNDEGQTASGTITFETAYERDGPEQPDETETAPTFTETEPRVAPPGQLVSITPRNAFDDAGTNPRITAAEFSTTNYYDVHLLTTSGVNEGIVFVQAKTAADLNALAAPPSSPFTVAVDVTMANDEGQTASGTLIFETVYERDEPEEEVAAGPTHKAGELWGAPPGEPMYASAEEAFDNAGTNPRFTAAVFSTSEYYNQQYLSNGKVWVEAKTAAELSALPSPPPSRFVVTVDVTMTNDEGQTATGTVTFVTTYVRVEPEEEVAAGPTPRDNALVWDAGPGQVAVATPHWVFDNVGTNPVFTAVEFSTTEYYNEHYITDGMVWVEAKTAAELNALPSPPPSPFEVTANATMTNDEGQTAVGTLIFSTTYDRVEPEEEEASEPVGPAPTLNNLANSGTILYPTSGGTTSYYWAHLLFHNPGTNPKFTHVTFSTTDYFSSSGIGPDGQIWMTTSMEHLNSLESLPTNPVTVVLTMTMTNDEGHTVTDTATHTVSWVEPEPEEEEEPTDTYARELPPGGGLAIPVLEKFPFEGTNVRISNYQWSTLEYYDPSFTAVVRGNAISVPTVWAAAKTSAELNALASPPPSPFTVDLTFTLTNNEGDTFDGTFRFTTTYDRVEPEEEEAGPTQKAGQIYWEAPHGELMDASAEEAFDNAGTNPRFTAAVFSTTEYYNKHYLSNGMVWVEVKTAAELNALPTPPPSPFTVTVDVTMTNDEGQTATGTVTFRTTYDRDEEEETEEEEEPTDTYARELPPGGGLSIGVLEKFPFEGTNVRISNYQWSTLEYYDPSRTGVRRGNAISDPRVWAAAKTSAELNALASPPPSPFTVDLTFTLTNNEGDTFDGTFRFTTTYDRDEPEEEEAGPTQKAGQIYWEAPHGELMDASAEEAFDNAGTNPRFTAAVFSTTEYYNKHYLSDGMVWVEVKTAAELNALPTPPPSPFTVTVDVTMTNDEGQTTTGTVTFRTTYDRDEEEETEETAGPTFSHTGTITADPGATLTYSADDLFDNTGTRPEITEVAFLEEYYELDRSQFRFGVLEFTVMSTAELNALASPPTSPFTVAIDVTMTNDEGQTATGTVTFRTTYDRVVSVPAAPAFQQGSQGEGDS